MSRERQRFRRRALVALIPLIGLVALVCNVFWAPGNPAFAEFEGHTLRLLDANNAVLWTHTLREAEPITDNLVAERLLIIDLDGDGEHEVLFAPARKSGETETLYCFSAGGDVRWKYSADEWLNGAPALPGAYAIERVVAVSDAARTFVALLTKHKVEAPARVVLLAPATGSVVDEYWHPGHLHGYVKVNVDDDAADELVLTGYNNPRSLGHPAVVVLNVPFDTPAENPRAAENYYGAWNAKEHDYLLFPRIPVLTANRLKTGANKVFLDDNMIVVVTSGGRAGMHAYFYFDSQLADLLRYRPNDDMLGQHRLLYKRGDLPTDATPGEITRWARTKRFATAPDGDDPRVAELIEASTETAQSIHTGMTPPPRSLKP